MVQSRKYESNAQRQTAYRERCRKSRLNELAAKGLPPLPAIPTIPGWERWRKGMAQVESLMTQIEREMEAYHDDRSEDWRESQRGSEFLEKLQELQEVMDSVTAWIG